MRLATGDMALELRIAGYQFPGAATALYDSNWLVIEGAVQHPRGNWRFRDPSLLTYEVTQLADWLEAVAAGAEAKPYCGFIEPNLSFEVVGTGATRQLRVSFAIEARPPWANREEEVYVEFPLREPELKAAVASLRRQLQDFPQRAER